ncbi:MAG: tRNA-dihydrouridine synthase family protein [Bdellovibrionaceae bacterium]|nr:tRNA-dihydrouridine synthase family protein [Pseudobdellovibrionaceae bacterium]
MSQVDLANAKERVYLAPMEGVVDATVRDLWTRVGGYDQVFTEFIRVTNQKIPDHVFFRECPELEVAFTRGHTTRTPNGTKLIVQLLGGDANWVAENAVRAVELGSPGIDLNFGCPAPTVNRHDGGAALLQKPERLFEMVSKVRAALPADLPVTAKMRLGFMDPSLCLENARAVSEGGAEALTVHCRTKKQMYQPPVDWTWLPRIREVVNLNLIVNGDIWTADDARACRAISGCADMMIGRSALTDPWLALKIKGLDAGVADEWPRRRALLLALLMASEQTPLVKNPQAFAVARVKQMLRSMAKDCAGAAAAFDQVKIVKTPTEVRELFSIPGSARSRELPAELGAPI